MLKEIKTRLFWFGSALGWLIMILKWQRNIWIIRQSQLEILFCHGYEFYVLFKKITKERDIEYKVKARKQQLYCLKHFLLSLFVFIYGEGVIEDDSA